MGEGLFPEQADFWGGGWEQQQEGEGHGAGGASSRVMMTRMQLLGHGIR